MQRRITLDWDKKIFERIHLKHSKNKGIHVIMWLRKPITNKKHVKLRKKFKDDKLRISLDKQRLKCKMPINILFNDTKKFFYKNKIKETKHLNTCSYTTFIGDLNEIQQKRKRRLGKRRRGLLKMAIQFFYYIKQKTKTTTQ